MLTSSQPHVPIGTSYCDDATYPAIPLPTGAFDLEGFGKDNPIGAVSGGAGGPTTTFRAADGASATSALVRAATVSHLAPHYVKST